MARSRHGRTDVAERFVTRGFIGRRTASPGAGSAAERIPPGQYLTTDFRVLSAGPTPRTPLDQWSFAIEGLVREPVRWTWEDFRTLPSRDWVVDISCVTKWTKLDMRWRGVSVDTLLEHVGLDPTAGFVIAYADGGYTIVRRSRADLDVERGLSGSVPFARRRWEL
jgi:DMSO/TMAO reductase YedYZ molybdopterin-dependent catalytic subunit